MTPKQAFDKAFASTYGKRKIYKCKQGWYTYHKITENVMCMVIHSEDDLGYVSHMTFAQVKGDDCTIIPLKDWSRYVSHSQAEALQKVKDIRKSYKQGNCILQGT